MQPDPETDMKDEKGDSDDKQEGDNKRIKVQEEDSEQMGVEAPMVQEAEGDDMETTENGQPEAAEEPMSLAQKIP